MAFNIGQAQFEVGLNLAAFKANVEQVKKLSVQAGKQVNKAFAPQKGSLTSLDIRINSLKEEINLVRIGSKRYKQLARDIKKASAVREKADRAMSGVGFRGATASFLTTAGQAAAGVASIVALTAGFRGAISKAIEFDDIAKKLQATLGQAGAAGAMNFARETSERLGLSLAETTNSFAKFTAAASSAGIPMKEQEELFAAVSQAGSVLALSNADMQGVFVALEQMAAKGVVSMEELRQQMGERLPIALSATAKGFDKPVTEIIALVESGKLAAKDFFPAFTRGLNEITAGAEGLETTSASFNRLKNAWDDLQVAFGKSMLPWVIDRVKELTAVLEGVGIVMRAQELGIGSGFLGNLFGQVSDQAHDIMGQLKFIEKQYKISKTQAAELFKEAQKEVGVWVTNMTTAKQMEKIKDKMLELAKEEVRTRKDAVGEALKEDAAAQSTLDKETKRAAQRRQDLAESRANRIAELEMEGQRLALYQKERSLVSDIASARGEAAVDRAGAIKNLLGIEQGHALKMAQTDKERAFIRQRYGQATFNQTVNEFALKAKSLVAEQAGQRVSLQLEQQKTTAAMDKAKVEAEARLAAAEFEARSKPDDAQAQEKLRTARAALELVKEQSRVTLGLMKKETAFLGVKQQAQREALGNQRLLALAQQKEFASKGQSAVLQGDINRMLKGTASQVDAASVSAGNFSRSMRDAAEERGKLDQSFKSQIKVHLSDSSTFQNIGTGIRQVATAVDKVANQPINIHISQQPGGGWNARQSSVAGTGL